MSLRWARGSRCSNNSHHQFNHLTSSIHAHCSPLAKNELIVYPSAGIGISDIVVMIYPAEISVVTSGVYHLIGNAIRDKRSTISSNHQWSHGRDVAGLLRCVNTNTVTWICYKASKNAYSFRRHNCTRRLSNISTLCSNSIYGISHCFVWCRQEVELRQRSAEGEVIRGRCGRMAFNSPTRVAPRLRLLGVTVQSLRNQIYRQNLVIKMLNKDSDSKISNVNAAT